MASCAVGVTEPDSAAAVQCFARLRAVKPRKTLSEIAETALDLCKASLHNCAMSRLDMFIDRMVSQRACINYAISATVHLDGPVFELGLGNGRTYHHLREQLSPDLIWVFERAIASHPDSRPPEDRVFLGDVFDTLPAALAQFGPAARLIHADLGGHNLAKNDAFARRLSPVIEPMLAVGGLMVSSDRMYFEGLELQSLPEGAVEGRCFIYKRLAAASGAGS